MQNLRRTIAEIAQRLRAGFAALPPRWSRELMVV
jgi:hypothetical protein